MRRGLLVLLPALILALGACGDRRIRGGFGRLDERAGLPDRLVLEGTPYEMGFWHGYLLKDRILKLRHAGVETLLRRMGFRLDAPGGVLPSVRQHLDLCVDQTLHRLSERVLQELEGMAAATGLEPEELIRLDVARDALRMKGLEAGLPGAAGLGRSEAGFEAAGFWGGADAAWLVEHALVIHRKPVGERESAALGWPGSVGAVAAAAAGGRGYLAAEVEMRDKRRLGFGGGRPFLIAAREALHTSPDAEDLLAAATATMGHLFVGFVARPDALPPVESLGGVGAFQGSPDPIVALMEDPFLALGPYEDARSPQVRSVWESVVRPEVGLEERWLRLREHAGRTDGGDGPEVRITWTPGTTTFAYRRSADAPAREVVLRD
ncbi:MAG: hypothetical protein QNJ90_10210 [Planctomycetota bacterium]|nr:hypothetical protein [Planctomycetota bacterium]